MEEVVGESTAPVEEAVVTEEPEVVLASDEVAFEVPEKFKGKSIEDVIKSYQELEKFKAPAKEEEVVKQSTEGEEPSSEVTKDMYTKYADSYDENGELSTEDYAELAEAGYSKEDVDKAIEERNSQLEFQDYKKSKALDSILEPLGGGQDKFKEVASWAKETKSPEDVAAFNEALAGSGKLAQQALLKGLYSEYDSAGNTEDTVLHTNTPQGKPSKGYTTQEEFFKDVGSEEYKNNPKYRAAVEAKMSKSDIF